jgi:hypothetical protein
MKWFEKFILNVPYLFLKKIPYAWVGVAAFWSWPPVASGILTGFVLLGLGMMLWQNRAWENYVGREYGNGEARPWVDHPHASRIYQVRNLLLVLAGSALLGWLLRGRFGLGEVQWAALLAGVMLLYKDAFLFGASVTYMVTDQGVGIRYVPGHVDYRLFFRFHEIRRAVKMKMPERFPRRWEMLVPMKYPKEGVLLYAVHPEGFSKQIRNEIFLAPTDIDGFLDALGNRVVVMHEPLSA